MSGSADLPAVLGGPPIRSDGPASWPRSDESIHNIFAELANTGGWGRYEGQYSAELCRLLTEFHNVHETLLCSSGTAAVELALRGLGVQTGDEVILAGYDFKANFQNILCLGATPVLVDLCPKSWQIDPGQVQNAITSQTRAIIVSHLHGGIVDLDQVQSVAHARQILVLEDACQNPGAIVQGIRAGAGGDVGVLSFGGSKLMTSGRGGAILTKSAEVAERIKRYQQRGNLAYPLSEMQAAVLIPQVRQLDHWNGIRRSSVELLNQRIGADTCLSLMQPSINPDSTPSYYKVGLRYHPERAGGISREQFSVAMRAEGIAIDPGFRALHLIHARRRFRMTGDLRESTRADQDLLTLHHPILLDGETGVEQIFQAIDKICRNAEAIRRLPIATCPTID